MKNLVYFTILFCAALFIYSCTPCPECPDPKDDDVELDLKDTISFGTFTDWIDAWELHGKSYIADTLIRYYTMPLEDIKEFNALRDKTSPDSIVAARFYLGLDTTIMRPHIMLVGVNSSGDSIISSSRKQYIYDVTRPCPTMCGEDSVPKTK